jgi:thiol-disulfide isomerase/thioredoxin
MSGDFMKVVKINSLGCPSCIIMNKIFNKNKEEYDIETVELDYDFDEEEVKKYNIGKILPVFIFFKDDKEIGRLNGEHKKEEFDKIIGDNL